VRVPQRALVVAASAIATIAALAFDLREYQSFLLLLGAFFVPLFGVLLAHWLLSGAHYSRDDVFAAPAFRAELLAAWLVGFVVYQWLVPIGPSWWLDLVDGIRPGTAGLDGVGASIPSFVVAFCLAALAVVARGATRPAVPSRT
jgi:purine-cytosine permease-like protein